MLILLAFYCQFNFFSRSTKDLRSLLRHFGFFFLGSVLNKVFYGGAFCCHGAQSTLMLESSSSFPYMTVRLLQPPLPLDFTLPGIW